ncbi:uncharacterized protein LOC113337064 [Papaver somniferum]|uniref:uncharacterized protein LOC113337064 n=1 Tax=Papaver somniferum TaxID=3469 RepID=UPI000E701940|nr:uncharacterized protein LOC113337064 [Papaver somniferum]
MDRLSPEYRAGVNNFIKVATQDARRRKLKKILCPCEICVNHCRKTESQVRYDLFRYGIDQSYTCWTKHGENVDALHDSSCTINFETQTSTEHEFEKGHKNEMLPDGNEIPSSTYEAKKSINPLGLNYVKIHYIARKLIWHDRDRNKNGLLRHPADVEAWKAIDERYPDFAKDPRNIRLGVVEAYDAYKQERFTLRDVVLWTISDYPALGNLSGCTVGGYHACATCGVHTHSTWLKYSRKLSYTGHRKWLPSGHRYRYQMNPFDGHQDFGLAPEPVSGLQRFEEAKSNENSWGKKGNGGTTLGKSTRSEFEDEDSANLKKLSIWAKELEYFKYNLVQHNFDLMHIEKNVCESLVGTLLNDPKKTKDGYKARMDLNDLKIRPELEPVVAGRRMYLPPACYTLTKDEKVKFCKTLYELKVPQGYSSNFSSLVSLKDRKLIGLKSHDYHVFMQQFLPLAVRSILPKNVRNTIIRLSSFFKSICKKDIDIAELDNIQKDLVETLCLLENYFLPSFFTIMIHLTVHLVREVKLCGPVFTRWMYPFERYMKILKGYIRNKNRVEGCIVNCSELEEFFEFAADWLSGVETIGIPPLKCTGNSASEGSSILSDGKPIQGAHEDEVEKELDDEDDTMAEEKRISKYLRWISQGPHHIVVKYNGYDINGCRYRTKRHDVGVNQNCGVSLEASGMHIASAKDSNPKIATSRYYGVIKEIWVLDYKCVKIPVFLCDWVHSGYGVKTDELGYTLVVLNRLGHKKDPFILAVQANQVFYVEDQGDPRWSVVTSCPLNDYIDDDDVDENAEDELMFENRRPEDNMAVDMSSLYVNDDSDTSYFRDDGQGIYVDPSFEQ